MAQAEIRAAGGVVLRGEGDERQVAIVHRARYDEWALPKGKLDGDESWEVAALREVREETGIDAEIDGEAGVSRYDVGGRPKEVRFFLMRPRGPEAFEPSEEVDQIVWLTLPEALRRLAHAEERAVLSAAAC